MKTGIIYKATCTKNGKVYIGQTVQGLKIRKSRHLNSAFNPKDKGYNFYFCRAIRKHKKDNFEWEVIYDNIPANCLDIVEIWTIGSYNSYKNGYNSTEGGKTNIGQLGKKHSKETKQKMSIAQRGRIFTKESRQKMSEAHLGKKSSKETKQKMSISHKGEKNYMYEKHHTEKSKKKISEALKGLYVGEKHPMAKLTWTLVNEIRKKYATGKYTQVSLTKKYNVSKITICRIVHNKSWIKGNKVK